MILTGKQVKYRGTVTGLRISAVDGTAFIDNALITPELQNAKLLSSGSVTAANLKLSAVDGMAFVDFSTADVLTDNIGKYIVIKDSTGKEIKGWIKAAGTGETLGDDALASWDLTSGWSSYSSTIVDANTYSTTATANGVRKNSFLIPNALYKFTGQFDISAAGSIWIADYNNSFFMATGIPNNILTTKYFTSKNEGILIVTVFSGSSTTNITSMALPIITAPSSTGVTIVSSKGGTTYNWESKDASFAYNSAITYSIYDRDLTAYADGNHQIEIYDSDNRMLRGVLKAAGTSEGLGDETVSGFTNVSYDVFTTDGANITNAEQTTAGTKICLQNYSYQVLALYKSVISLTLVSGLAPKFGIGRDNTLGSAADNSKQLSNGVNTNYHTPSYGVGACGFYNTSNSKWNTSGISLKQVTAPSSSGCTIVSAKGGETYNWAYKNSSFVFNASSYYCIIKAIR